MNIEFLQCDASMKTPRVRRRHGPFVASQDENSDGDAVAQQWQRRSKYLTPP